VEAYFSSLEQETKRAYEVATKARSLGIDPETYVEIPQARDMASRVEKLLVKWHVEGVADRIRAELAKKTSRELVAIRVAEEMALDESRGNREKRLDVALRVGLAILTEGILVAPLEGLVNTRIHDDPAGAYVDLQYAGPIRAAGGTAQAMSVLLADVVRRRLGIAAYKATPEEIGRYEEEIPLYKHIQHLQYLPKPAEIELVVSHVPVCINGEPTEKGEEVTAFRNVKRVGHAGIRGGACLVIAEGICLKAPKLKKIVEKLGIDGWEFLKDLGKGTKTDEGKSSKYLEDAVGGRPILAHPNRAGGFRLVYGRTRTTGLAATALNPATMVILRDFVAIGTQLKTEFPGKATVSTPCDTIEGPLVLLEDGSFVAVNDVQRAKEVLPDVRGIVDLGEILVPFGEFLENNHPLMPGAYSIAWHLEEARRKGLPIGKRVIAPTWEEALEDSMKNGLPLHPRFNLFWHDLALSQLHTLSEEVERRGAWRDSRLVLPNEPALKEILLMLGLLHVAAGNVLLVDPELSRPVLLGLGLEIRDGAIVRRAEISRDARDALDGANRAAGICIKARSPTRLGARVGRPEKACHRDMDPPVHALFPVGLEAGPQRSFNALAGTSGPGTANVTFGVRKCPKCGSATFWTICSCGNHTEPTDQEATRPFPVGDMFRSACDALSIGSPPQVKGVRGLFSHQKTPEPLGKGILRAKHGLTVYQDGTCRFDLTDIPLTHFRPEEIGLSVEKARALGYATDWTGEPLKEPDQLLELRPQDLIISTSCGDEMLALSKFVDDELRLLYDTGSYYKASSREDLIGQLMIALAPHTSGGVLGRIIGYTEVEGCFAHPAFHASKRRNCDGDGDSVTLLLDGLLNFSFAFLPESRGAYMDKPLVLTMRLDVREVDKEAHNVDISCVYPIELYECAERWGNARDVEGLIETVSKRLENPAQHFSGYSFTHDTRSISEGPIRSAYRQSTGMKEMVAESMFVMSQIRAVDLAQTITSVLNRHFLPDIMGNLTSFATQKFRCKKCGATYRRPPLVAKCVAQHGKGICGGDLSATVYEGSVKKYMELSRNLADQDGVGKYLKQRVGILEGSMSALFPDFQRRLMNYIVEDKLDDA
jgi:DNA polymerase II large subunit